MENRAVWLYRVLWFLIPLTVGRQLIDATSPFEHAVPGLVLIGGWILWAITLVASMVPQPATLTLTRILSPATLPIALWAGFELGWGALDLVALIHAAVVTGVVLSHLVGDRFADGASYGDERRMLLRPPSLIGYLLGPILWALIVASAVTGPLLLANQSWVLGVIATLIGAAIVVLGIRSLHQLALRWIVFVPTGMVLHDLMVLTEPVLFRRTSIERLGAAIAGTPARDLSNKAPGLLLECELTDPAPLGLRDISQTRATGATITDTRRFLFCPTRPGELLNEAERRNMATDG